MKKLLAFFFLVTLTACNGPNKDTIEVEEPNTDRNDLFLEDVIIESEWELMTEEKGYDVYHTTVINPTSEAELSTYLLLPNTGAEQYKTVVLVPGGVGSGTGDFSASRINDFIEAETITVYFDIDGRGESTGEEDFNGYIGQDGLYAISEEVANFKSVNTENMGLISYSYGLVMASGMLARYADEQPFQWYMDWEGPSNREYVTVGCPDIEDVNSKASGAAKHTCDDDEYWSEREATTFLAEITIPYQRVQGVKDHVQASNEHAIDAINAATEGLSPWTRINLEEENMSYSYENPPEYINHGSSNQIYSFAEELFTLF